MNPKERYVSDELLDEMDAGIMILGRLMASRHADTCEGMSVSGPRMLVLRVLSEAGPMKQSDLASLLGIKAPATTSLVDTLEREGLADRMHDAEDRRITLVQLTESGREALQVAEQHRREHMRRYLSVLPDEDIRTLIRIQRTLIAAIVDND